VADRVKSVGQGGQYPVPEGISSKQGWSQARALRRNL
jgi:hypothetical protein